MKNRMKDKQICLTHVLQGYAFLYHFITGLDVQECSRVCDTWPVYIYFPPANTRRPRSWDFKTSWTHSTSTTLDSHGEIYSFSKSIVSPCLSVNCQHNKKDVSRSLSQPSSYFIWWALKQPMYYFVFFAIWPNIFLQETKSHMAQIWGF